MSVLTPEARRWLQVPVPRAARVTVVGVAGGVGTTTVAGLLWWALTTYADRQVALLDHGGGALAARLPTAATVAVPDVELHDAGAVPPAQLGRPGVLVLVCGAHAAGLQAAATALGGRGPGGAVVVPVATSGTGRTGRVLRDEVARLGLSAPLVPVRRNRALAAGGDVPGAGTARSLGEVYRTAVALAAEVLRCLSETPWEAPAQAPSGMGSSPHPDRR